MTLDLDFDHVIGPAVGPFQHVVLFGEHLATGRAVVDKGVLTAAVVRIILCPPGLIIAGQGPVIVPGRHLDGGSTDHETIPRSDAAAIAATCQKIGFGECGP